MKSISDNNPDLEEMKEQGWAWLQRSKDVHGGHKYGAPYSNDEWAERAVERHHPDDGGESVNGISHQELIIVSWEDVEKTG